MGNEKNFENRVKKFLKDEGCWFVKYWGGGVFTKAGVPDLLVCCNGRFLGVELKAPMGEPSELQLLNLFKIDEADGYGWLLYPDKFEDFKQFIRLLKQRLITDAENIYHEKRGWKKFESLRH